MKPISLPSGQLKADLCEANEALDWQHDLLEAKQQKISAAELSLHALLPQARETTQRLFLALANHVVEADYKRLLSQIHTSLREEAQIALTELAVKCTASVEIKTLSPPAIPFLASTSLNGDGLFQPFPVERKEKMEFVCKLSEAISDKLISLSSLGIYFSSATARADEECFRNSATEILDYLGLSAVNHVLARNLPHGHLRESRSPWLPNRKCSCSMNLSRE